MQLSFFDDPLSETSLADIQQSCLTCTACRLSETRQHVVFGSGNPQAALMLIGQGPSQRDNETGLPYSGPSGDVLDKALAKVGFNRQEIWLTNIHKCLAYDAKYRKLRLPKERELAACRKWLMAEINLINPQVIVCLGGPAAQNIINTNFKLNEQRGEWFKSMARGIKTLATYQPAYLMRLKEWDRPAAVSGWETLIADLTKAVLAING